MKKIDWKILIITSLICIIPIIFGIVLYEKLPDQMAVHFGINNEPNEYAPKEFALFGIPIFMTLLQIVCCIFSDLLEQKRQNKKYISIYKWIIPIIGIVCYLTMIAYGTGINLDMRMIVCITLGILFTILENYLPKTIPNKFQLTYMRKEHWEKIKRPVAYFFVVMGLLFVISTFLNPLVSFALVGVIIIFAVVLVMYSIYLFHKDRKVRGRSND